MANIDDSDLAVRASVVTSLRGAALPTAGPSASTPPTPAVDIYPATPTTVVRIDGELDVVAEPEISLLLDTLSRQPGTDLVVDLRGVTFLDCSGVSPLIRARSRLRAGGGRLRLVVASPGVERLLRMAHLERAFDIMWV